MKATQVSLADFAKDADAVQVFCEKRGLAEYALLAVDLVKEYFDVARPTTLDVEPGYEEDDDDHLIVEFTARGGVEAVLETYHRLIERWVREVPLPQQLMVCFYYKILP